jgi:hypothetical protein
MPYRLVAESAPATALRREELCGLAVFPVPETAHLDEEDHPLIGVSLTIAKGDNPRTIYPPHPSSTAPSANSSWIHAMDGTGRCTGWRQSVECYLKAGGSGR